MKKTVLTTIFIILSGCASSPKYENFSTSQLQQALTKFKSQDGDLIHPVRGKFKEVATYKSASVGSHGFTCSGTDTIKYVHHMNVYTDDNGIVTAKSITNDCGTTGAPLTLSGIQTKSNLYLHPQNSNKITSYKIDNPSGKLIRQGNYQPHNGTLIFNKSRQNNETWSEGLGSNYSYKTTSYAPETLWSEVDRFERSIVVKKGGSAAGEFQWGKALALGVGAVAGGGLKLDTDTQASVISGIVLDSLEDTSGTSNLNEAVSDAVRPVAAPSISTQAAAANRTTSNTQFPSSTASSSASDTSSSVSTVSASSRPLYVYSYSDCTSQVDLGSGFKLRTLSVTDYPKPIPAPSEAEWKSENKRHADSSKARLRKRFLNILANENMSLNSRELICLGGYSSPSPEADIQKQIQERKDQFESSDGKGGLINRWYK